MNFLCEILLSINSLWKLTTPYIQYNSVLRGQNHFRFHFWIVLWYSSALCTVDRQWRQLGRTSQSLLRLWNCLCWSLLENFKMKAINWPCNTTDPTKFHIWEFGQETKSHHSPLDSILIWGLCFVVSWTALCKFREVVRVNLDNWWWYGQDSFDRVVEMFVPNWQNSLELKFLGAKTFLSYQFVTLIMKHWVHFLEEDFLSLLAMSSRFVDIYSGHFSSCF